MLQYFIIPAIATLINVAAMAYVAALGSRNPVHRSYLLFSGVITAWMLTSTIFFMPIDPNLRMPLMRASSITWFITGFTFLNFSYVFLGRPRDRAYWIVLAASLGAIALSVGTDLIIVGYREYVWGWRFREGPLFTGATMSTVIVPVIMACFLFLRERGRSDDPVRRMQLALFSSGIILSLALASAMQFVIHRLPGFEQNVRYTAPASAIMSLFVFYMIIRFRFLTPDIRDIAADLFRSVGDGVAIMDPAGRVLHINASAAEILGIGDVDPASLSLASCIPGYDPAATYTNQQMETGSDGEGRSVLITQSGVKVHDRESGKILIIKDITALASASRSMYEAQELYNLIAHNVTDMIWTLDLATMSITYVSPSVERILGYTAEEFMATPLAERIEATSLAQSIAVLGEEFEHDRGRDPGRTRSLEMVEFRRDGTNINTELHVSFLRNAEGAPYAVLGITRDITDRKRMETVLRESIAQIRERNEVIERDLAMAQLVQRALLPGKLPVVDQMRIDYRYFSLEAVGGDYFNIIPFQEGGLGVFLGDVSGHGVPSALFLSLIKSVSDRLIRSYAMEPSTFLSHLNEDLVGYLSSYFMTAVYGVFHLNDRKGSTRLVLASGGHPDPIIRRHADGEVAYIPTHGKLLGVFTGMRYADAELHLTRGDRVFFYTDGLVETTNSERELIGFEGLLEIMRKAHQSDLGGTLDAIIDAIAGFRGSAPVIDDVVIIGIEIL